jgi:hypothetical protein
MKPSIKKLAFVLREAFAVTLWFWIFTKFFVYDIDLILVNQLPWLQKIYPYKFFIIAATIAVLLILRVKWRFFLYVLGYPFIILFWRIPKLLFKNWATVLMFLPAIESVALKLKWRFALWTFATLAAIGIILLTDPVSLTFCMLFLGLYLLVHYFWRLRSAYRPESIFGNVATGIGKLWVNSIKGFKDKDFADRSKGQLESPEFNKKHVENVKNLYITSLLCTWVGAKLDQAVSSRRTDLYFIIALIYTFFLTVIIFGFEYWALFKIDPSNYTYTNAPSFWAFFVYSFNVILHTSFSTVAAMKTPALAIANAELLGTLIIGVFLVFVIFTSHRERYRQDLSRVVKELTRSAEEIETFIRRKLRMTLIDVEITILKVDPTFTNTLESFGRTPPQIASPKESDEINQTKANAEQNEDTRESKV